MLRRILLVAVAALSIIAVACSGGGSGDIEPADSYTSLSAALEAGGMKIGGQIDNNPLFARLFSVQGIEMTASGQEILAFEFESIEVAEEQAALVSEDGYGIGLKYVNWVDEPKFFKNGKMIVIYDGTQSLVIDTLVAAMGDIFAGGSTDGA